MQIPALAGAIDEIARTVANIPIKLYRKEGKRVEEIKGDRRVFLLNEETGDTLDANQMKQAVVRDYYLGRGGFVYVDWAETEVESLTVRMEPVQLLDVLLRHFHAAPTYGEPEMPDLPLHGDDPRDDADVDAVQPGSSLPVPVRLHAAGARETFLGDHADPDLRVLQDIRHFRTGAVAVLPEVLA